MTERGRIAMVHELQVIADSFVSLDEQLTEITTNREKAHHDGRSIAKAGRRIFERCVGFD